MWFIIMWFIINHYVVLYDLVVKIVGRLLLIYRPVGWSLKFMK